MESRAGDGERLMNGVTRTDTVFVFRCRNHVNFLIICLVVNGNPIHSAFYTIRLLCSLTRLLNSTRRIFHWILICIQSPRNDSRIRRIIVINGGLITVVTLSPLRRNLAVRAGVSSAYFGTFLSWGARRVLQVTVLFLLNVRGVILLA